MVDPKIVLPKTCEDVQKQREQESVAIQRANLQICANVTHANLHKGAATRVKFTRRRLSCPEDRVLPSITLQGHALLEAVVGHQYLHPNDEV